MSIRKVLGYSLLASPFVGLFALLWIIGGDIRLPLALLGSVVVLLAVILIGVRLVVD